MEPSTPTASLLQHSIDTGTARTKQTHLRHLTQAANHSNRRKFDFGVPASEQCFLIWTELFFSKGRVYEIIEDDVDEDGMESQNEDDEPNKAFEQQGINSETWGKGALSIVYGF